MRESYSVSVWYFGPISVNNATAYSGHLLQSSGNHQEKSKDTCPPAPEPPYVTGSSLSTLVHSLFWLKDQTYERARVTEGEGTRERVCEERERRRQALTETYETLVHFPGKRETLSVERCRPPARRDPGLSFQVIRLGRLKPKSGTVPPHSRRNTPDYGGGGCKPDRTNLGA